MAQKGLSMGKIREVLRLRALGLSQQEIARSSCISQPTVHRYLERAEAAGLSWPLPEDWDDHRLQELIFSAPARRSGYYGSPAYFNNAVYFSGADDFLDRYSLTSGLLSVTPVSESATKFVRGSTPSISANGTTNGIVWAIDQGATSTATALAHAYNAANLSKELYNSSQNPARDTLGPGIKFSVPTIANRKVYIGVKNSLVVYGILP